MGHLSTSPVLIHSLIPSFSYSLTQQIRVEHHQQARYSAKCWALWGETGKSSVLGVCILEGKKSKYQIVRKII